MAKGKHAAALFEVIHSGKDRQQDKSGLLSTPKWWFKNKAKSQPLPGEAPGRDANADDEQPIFRPIAMARSDDRSARRLTLQFPYRKAALWAGGAVAVIAIGFILGQKMRGGPAPANAVSIDQLKHGPVNADSLRVGAGTSAPGAGTRNTSTTPPLSQPVNLNSNSNGANTASPQQPAAFNGKRVVNQQYVVIQSYPKEVDAKAAADLLIKNGIGCTIQQGFWPGRKDWFTVIGTTGFERTENNPEYTKYLQSIARISNEFAGKTRFRQFDPLLYTWKDPNH